MVFLVTWQEATVLDHIMPDKYESITKRVIGSYLGTIVIMT